MACLLEASSPKAGNVHPTSDFDDMTYLDFLASSVGIAHVFDNRERKSVGELVHSAVSWTQMQLSKNTNLGTILLLAPLARAASHCGNSICSQALRSAVEQELRGLNACDAELVYRAILLAKPGGLGRSSVHDIRGEAPLDLVEAMRLASNVDAVARQYVYGFQDIFDRLLPWLMELTERYSDLREAICGLQLRWMAAELDGLIVRKTGTQIAEEARGLAELAWDELRTLGRRATRFVALDSFLRADGHRRNPGTTADLIAATLFVALILTD